jgi:hypothetical protein
MLGIDHQLLLARVYQQIHGFQRNDAQQGLVTEDNRFGNVSAILEIDFHMGILLQRYFWRKKQRTCSLLFAGLLGNARAV